MQPNPSSISQWTFSPSAAFQRTSSRDLLLCAFTAFGVAMGFAA